MQLSAEPEGAAAPPKVTSLAEDLAAKFDIDDSPPGSATTSAAHTAPFAPDLRQPSEGVLTTISLDGEGADDAAGAAAPTAPTAAATAAAVAGAASSAAAAPASAAEAALPPSSRPQSSSGRASGAGSSQALAALAGGTTVQQQPQLAESHGKGSRVKVLLKDAEKAHERGRLGVPFGGGYVTCLVRTECAADCPLAASAGEAAGAAGAAEAGGGSGAAGARVFEVRRRYDEFEGLARALRAHHRGYFLPRLPPSEWLAGGDASLNRRRVDLQDYLAQVANHPAMQASAELRLFLTQPGDLAVCARWQSAQALLARPAPMEAMLGLRRGQEDGGGGPASAAAAPAAGGGQGGGGSGLGVMLRMKHSLMSAVQPKAQPELSADEQQLQQAKEWLKEMQQHLSACVGVVRSLVSHLEAAADDFGGLGRTFSAFARFQEACAVRQGQYTAAGSSAQQRGADLQRLGYGALRQHSLSKQHVINASACLVFLHDFYSFLPECIATLQEREDALAAVNLLADELRDKQAAAARAAGALGPAAAGDKRLAGMHGVIAGLQDKLLAAEQQYTLLKDRNKAELSRINLASADDFRQALGRFAAVQAQAAAAAADVWSGVAEQFAQELEQQQQHMH